MGWTFCSAPLHVYRIMTKLKITQVRSLIHQSAKQRGTMEALGLRRINMFKIHNNTPQIMGMIVKVRHLIKVEEVAN